MSLIAKLKDISQKADAKYKQFQAEEEARAEKRLASLKTKTARDKERARLQRERIEAKTEVTEAKTALRKAQSELKSNKGGGFDLNSLFKKKAPVRAVRHRTVKRRRK